MILPSTKLERRLLSKDYSLVIGVDEVGMGSLAGPVVICAAALDRSFFNKRLSLLGVRDSKLLSLRQREALFAKLLKQEGLSYQISYCYPKTIDRINIYQASRRAMRRAINKLNPQPSTLNPIVLIDGPHPINDLDLPQQAIIKGDRHVFSIACASILAKVYRDRMMIRYAKRFPEYGFEKHKGYGTLLHRSKLSNWGPCAIHRKSFSWNHQY